MSFQCPDTNVKDIRNLIEEWADDISESERIWLRASGSNRKIFIDYDGAAISKGDDRLRTFPFPTRRPVSIPDARIFNTKLILSDKIDTSRAIPMSDGAHKSEGYPFHRRGSRCAR